MKSWEKGHPKISSRHSQLLLKMGFAPISKTPTASQGKKIKASNLLKGKSTSVINKGCHCLSVLQTQAEWINDLLHWGLTALLTVSFLIICGSGWTEMHLFLLHPFFLPFLYFFPICLCVHSFLNYISLLFAFFYQLHFLLPFYSLKYWWPLEPAK